MVLIQHARRRTIAGTGAASRGVQGRAGPHGRTARLLPLPLLLPHLLAIIDLVRRVFLREQTAVLHALDAVVFEHPAGQTQRRARWSKEDSPGVYTRVLAFDADHRLGLLGLDDLPASARVLVFRPLHTLHESNGVAGPPGPPTSSRLPRLPPAPPRPRRLT